MRVRVQPAAALIWFRACHHTHASARTQRLGCSRHGLYRLAEEEEEDEVEAEGGWVADEEEVGTEEEALDDAVGRGDGPVVVWPGKCGTCTWTGWY
jgi:hypothetical protein